MTGMTRGRRVRRRTLHTDVRPGGLGNFVGWMLLFALGFGAALLYVRFSSDVGKKGAELRDLRRRVAILAKEANNLELEAETFRSGDHIRLAAKRFKLGLRAPVQGQVYRMSAPLPPPPAPYPTDGVVARN